MSNIAPVATISSQAKQVGSEILVNSATVGEQFAEQITTLANGNFVVTWQDGGPFFDLVPLATPGSLGVGGATGDASGGAIKAQMFTASGSPFGGEFLVNTTVLADQSYPAVNALPNGGFVVTWTDFSQEAVGSFDPGKVAIKAQVYAADGAQVGGEILVNTSTGNFTVRTGSQVTGLADGGFVVTWADIGVDVFAQKFSAAGTPVGTEIRVGGPNSGAGIDPPPQVMALKTGGFVVAWASDGGAATQVYDAAGAAVGGVTTDAGFSEVQTAALDTGGFVKLEAARSGQITAQVFSDAGVAAGAPTAIQNSTGNNVSFEAQIAALPHGQFVVTWEQDGTTVAQVFDANATAVTGPIFVSSSLQSDLKVIALSNGDFVVTGIGGVDDLGHPAHLVEARVFAADGTPLGNQFTVNSSTGNASAQTGPGHSHLQIVAQPNGGFVVTWTDDAPGTLGAHGDDSLSAVKAQVLNAGYVATEGVALNLQNTGLSVSDPDDVNAFETVTVTLSVSEGILNVSAGTLSNTHVSGSGTGSVTITGRIQQLNTLLGFDPTLKSSVSFIDSSHTPASHVTLTLAINDNAGADALTATTSTTIQIVPVNEPPANTAPELVIAAQDADAAIAGLSVSDPDSPSMTTTLHVDHGTLKVAATGGATVSGSGTSSVTLSGSVAQIDAALSATNGVIYHGTSSFFGVDHLVMTSNDGASLALGGPLTATSTTLIAVTAGDTTPPDTAITAGPSGTVSSASATFDFSSTEPNSTFTVSLDGAAFAAASDPATFTGLADGQHTFQVRAIDASGNVDASPASRTWTVDTTPPDTLITAGPSGSVNSTSATFNFSSTEANSTFEVSLDNAAFVTANGPATFTGLTDGQHTFQVRATDAVGNTDATPASRTWTVDPAITDIAPVATISNQPKQVGSEILVNSATIGIQWIEQITTLANGNFVVTWEDGGPRADLTASPFPGSQGVGGATGDSSGGAIKAQMFTAGGSPIGGEFLVNTAVQGDQSSQAINALPNGGFVVTWTDFSQDVGNVGKIAIKAQVYGADGAQVGSEIMVNTSTDDGHIRTGSQVTGLADSGFVVTWAEIGVDVFAQKFSAAGTPVGGEILVGGPNSGPAFEPPPQVTALDNGGFVVAWAGNGGAITQVYDAAGAAVGGVTTDGGFHEVQTAALDTGGFVELDASFGGQMTAQVFSDAGVAAGAPVAIPATAAPAGFGPQIAALPHGHFVVTWEAQQSNSIVAIDAQVFDADGTAVTGPFSVSTAPPLFVASGGIPNDNRGLSEKITALSNGDFVITWNDPPLNGDSPNSIIEARVFTADGTPLGDQFTASTSTGPTHLDPHIVAQPNGGFVVTWTDEDPGAFGAQGDDSLTAIKAQVFNLGYVATEGVALNLKATGLSVSDADGNGVETVTLSVSEGILNVSPGSTQTQVSGSGTGSVTVIGPTNTLNALLGFDPTTVSSVSFIDTSDAPASHVTLTLTIDDNAGGTATASTTIQIVPVNDPPANTAPELVVAAQNTDAVVAGLSVSDPDSPSMTTTLHVDHGTLRVAATGGVTVSGSGTSSVTLTGSVAQIGAALSAANGVIYHGASSFFGADHLVMTSNDGGSFAAGGPQTATSTTLISVTAAPSTNTPPVALDATAHGAENTTITGTLAATHDDGTALSFSDLTHPAHGNVTVNLDGTFNYTPNANYHGSDSFIFEATDGAHDSIATETLSIDVVDHAPVAQNGAASGSENSTIAGALSAGDSDGDALAYRAVAQAAHGSVTINPDGTFSYAPDANYHGADSFTFAANDGTLDSNIATESLTVGALNHGPVQNDFDGSGHSSLLWQNTDGTAAVWSVDGTSLVAGASVAFNPGPSWHAIGAGDFNADGKADILWQNANGQAAVWEMNGSNILSGANAGFNPGAAWHVIGAGDFDGDGKADILWQNTNGQAAVWLMDGQTVKSGANAGPNPGADWHVIGTGDFDGDGKADILWQNNNGQAAVWLMDGTTVKAAANVGFNPGADWHVQGAGDFNGDGKADILWQNANGQAAVWEMNGLNVLSGANVGFNPGPAWQVHGAGDFNGDGKADIEWQNADGTAAVWLMDGTSLISGANVGFDPGSNWHVIPPHHDLMV